MSWKNYVGYLAVANPSNPRDELEKSVYFIVNHSPSLAIGLRINLIQPDTDLSIIAQNLGIDFYRNDPVYASGDRNINKIHMIHSLDWKGVGTIPLTKEIGITNDISILIALAENDGPDFYKACAGFGQWSEGVFEQQLSPTIIKNNPYKWEMVPATLENVFAVEDEFLWEHCIQYSILKKVKDYF